VIDEFRAALHATNTKAKIEHMRYVRQFTGFAGIRIESDDIGSALDPSVVILHDFGETRKAWSAAADALVLAGRHAINVDLRGHGGSDWPTDRRYQSNAFVSDIKSVLGQMRTRPVIVAKGISAALAVLALAEDALLLASGLVLIDMPENLAVESSKDRSGRSQLYPAGPGQPQWDDAVFAGFDQADLKIRVETVLETITLPTLVITTGQNDTRLAEGFLPGAEHVHLDDAPNDAAGRSEAFSAALVDFLERKQPLAPPEFRSGSDPRTLRDAMGVFATGVTIVTSIGPTGEPIGLTANSFTSVSLNPPLLLVCIANSSSNAVALRQNARFAVNVLQIGQQPMSNRFAGKADDRFSENDWEWGESGVPIMLGSLGVFECTKHALHDAGDHFILIGQVTKASFEPRRDPLLYFRGKYRRLHFT
jgi:flavin reductase (DIM6/NTAB) family NADH-FMN oxidoreductase RutF